MLIFAMRKAWSVPKLKRKLTMNYKNYIKGCILLFALSMSSVAAYAADDDDIIEFQGDRYVIHVDRMHPDSEMTLLDVLNTCPEFLSINGKKIDQNYKLRTDNIDLVVDAESFLAHVKACEIDHIQICSNTSVAKAVNGTKGVIDIYYRNDSKNDGKVALSGSTYGNGMLYADVANRSEKLTVQAYALARSSYGKAYPTDVYKMTDRGLAENVHLSLDWKISKNDRLFIQSIPFNFYAMLTLVMMAFIIFMKMDYGPMLLHENNARQGDLLTSGKGKQPPAESPKEEHVGRVSDLVVPVVLLVTGCVIGMIYTGGFFQGKSFAEAFAASDASVGLVMGSSVALVTTQLPDALTVASVSFFTFLLAGFIKNALLSLLFGIVALFLLLVFIRRRYSSRQSTVSCKHHK